MATKVEAKLGKSLDAIIEENRKKLSVKKDKPAAKKGIRVDGGARRTKGIVAAAKKAHRAPMDEDVPMRAPRARSGAAGLGVQRGGVSKPRRGGGNAASAFMHDDRTGPANGAGAGDDDYGMGGGRAGGRAARRAPPAGNSDGRWSHDMYDEREQRTVARRAPTAVAAAGSSAANNRLEVENLAWKVTDQDLLELFQTVGPVNEAKVGLLPNGRSTGRGYIIFRRAGDVAKAISEYNGVALDGRELVLTPFTGPVGAAAVLSSGLTVTRPVGAGGGAGASRAAAPAPRAAAYGRMGAPSGGRMSAPAGGRMYSQSVPRSGGGGGGARGGRMRSGVVGRSQADLDAEMDNYMQE